MVSYGAARGALRAPGGPWTPLELLGPGHVDCQAPPIAASEDFAFMLDAVPGCYLWIGNGEGAEGGCMVHNPGYDFNDAALGTGASYWVKLAEAYLSN